MKANPKLLVLALPILLACGGGGGGATSTPAGPPAPGAGGGMDQVVNAAGATVTASFSSAVAITDSRKVIGYAEVTPGSPFAAALWTVTGTGAASVAPAALRGLVQGGFAAGFAIDAAGDPVGQASDGTRLVAVIWPGGQGTPAALPPLNPAGDYAAFAISADGSVIAGQAADAFGEIHAVVWVAAAGVFSAAPIAMPVDLFAAGLDPSAFSSAVSVARVGAAEILVAGSADDGADTLHAALWRSLDAGASFAPTDLGAGFSASAVNLRREVVGESDDNAVPFLWSVDSQGLAGPPLQLAGAGSALAINDQGRIAGWSGAAPEATIWNGGATTMPFGSPSQANGLNNESAPLVVGRNGSYGFVTQVP